MILRRRARAWFLCQVAALGLAALQAGTPCLAASANFMDRTPSANGGDFSASLFAGQALSHRLVNALPARWAQVRIWVIQQILMASGFLFVLPGDSQYRQGPSFPVEVGFLSEADYKRGDGDTPEDELEYAVKQFIADPAVLAALTTHLFGEALDAASVEKARAQEFQAGQFLRIFRVDLRLRDGRRGTVVVDAPTWLGTFKLAIEDFAHLQKWHALRPGQVVKPIVTATVPLAAKGRRLCPLFALEWLGDFVELNSTFFEAERFELNYSNRHMADRAALPGDRRSQFRIVQAISRWLTALADYDPPTRRISFVDQMSFRRGDVMARVASDDTLDFRLITIRAIAAERNPEDFLDLLFGNNLFGVYSAKNPAGVTPAAAILEGVREGLLDMFPEEGASVFQEWMVRYRRLLEDRARLLSDFLDGGVIHPELRAWLDKETMASQHVPTRFYAIEEEAVRDALESGRAAGHSRAVLQDQKGLADLVAAAITDFLQAPPAGSSENANPSPKTDPRIRASG